MAIKRELGPVEGVKVVDVDVPTKAIDLEYADEAALARAKAKLDEIGYPVAKS
jgi:copper chaperone CopZ